MADDNLEWSDRHLAQTVLDRWKAGSEFLEHERRQYWLNLAFYEGQQWIFWDRWRRQARSLAEIGVETNRIRSTTNLIQSRTDRLVGQLTQRELAFEVPPSAPDDATLTGAKLAEQVVAAEHDDGDWNAVRVAEIYDALYGGVSAVSVEWQAGAQPAWSQNDQFESGVDGQAGSVELREWAVTEFAVEPGVRRTRDARWWISCVALPPEVARDYYRLGYTPEPDASRAYSPLQRQLMKDRGVSNLTDLALVYTYYERPNEKCPEGRYVVVIGDKVVRRREWPFPFPHLNVETFTAKPMPGTWSGTTMLSSARSPQTAYNHIESIILEHAKRAGTARMLIPAGSLADPSSLTDTPGEMVEYFPDGMGGGGPRWMEAPEMSRYIFMQQDKIIGQIDEIMHSNEVARGVAPGDRNSGLALSILAERNDTPLGVMAHSQAKGWERLASMALRLFGAHASGQRQSVVTLEGGVPYAFHWNGAQLQGQHRVHVPLESTRPESRSALAAQYMELSNRFPQITEGVPRAELLRIFNMPGRRTLEEAVDPDSSKAQYENSLLVAGEVPFPDTFDNHAAHMAVHNSFRKSRTYRYLPDQLRQSVDDHVQAHQRLMEEEAAAQAELNDVVPGLGALPQADEPVGSAVPPSPLDPQTGAGQ